MLFFYITKLLFLRFNNKKVLRNRMDVNGWIDSIKRKFISAYEYCTTGVWNETKSSWWINIIKTLNLSARSFLDVNLQMKASALTYSTLLAIVPALAMLFAIGRGFGFQNILQTELFKYFPAQTEALNQAFSFVDSYLAQSSEGIFVGIGIVFLLWTLISLLMNVEDAFNHIWGVKNGRSIYRKITDYTAIFLMLPILMICASGISIFMSTALDFSANLNFLSPVVTTLLDVAPFVLTWLFFTGAFMLIPYTKVKFKYALLSGILCGTAFQLLQLLFVTGQIYVSKYNAIYGSFAFLPLLLIWMQLTWVICLSGAVLTYSSQNIFRFNFSDNINEISERYLNEITIIVLAIITKRFEKAQTPYSKPAMSKAYDIPIRLVGEIIDRLVDAGLLVALAPGEDGMVSYQPAVDPQLMTVGYVFRKLECFGKSSFIPHFTRRFKEALKITNNITEECYVVEDKTHIKDLPVRTDD